MFCVSLCRLYPCMWRSSFPVVDLEDYRQLLSENQEKRDRLSAMLKRIEGKDLDPKSKATTEKTVSRKIGKRDDYIESLQVFIDALESQNGKQ